MFDRTYVRTAAPYPQTVTHKLAPTDESLRLLQEMQDLSNDRILRLFNVKDNALEGRILVQGSTTGFGYDVHFMFLLNGHAFRGVQTFDENTVADKKKLLTLFREFAARSVAEVLIGGSLEEVQKCL